MAENILQQLINILPRRPKAKGTSQTSTFQNNTSILSEPTYREHLTDLFTNRVARDSRELLSELFEQDSDASAALHAYLTVANTRMRIVARNAEGDIDAEATKAAQQVVTALTRRLDYQKGFQLKPGLESLNESLRYMVLLRGAIAGELIFDKLLVPSELRIVDMATIKFTETEAGKYIPQQTPPAGGNDIPLDIPNFFISYYRRNPAKIYPRSPFVSAINTIAARQQVVNDLYRIMQRTGYPRLEATVMENILRANAPADIQNDEDKLRAWVNARTLEIQNGLNNLRADSSIVHTDAVEMNVLNEAGPKSALDASAIMEVLNAQNQAALKTMATIIGRGTSGVNTASVEARVFSMNADEINVPLADFWSRALTLSIKLLGVQGYVEVDFEKAELRPQLELEPQKTMQQTRLLEQLSLGTITDEEFHLKVNGRLPPPGAPQLSGTNFRDKNTLGFDEEGLSPNGDSLGRGLAPEGSESARSNSNGS